MSTKCSTPSKPRSRPSRALVLALVLAASAAPPAGAQMVVFDPTNHIENALQAARQLQSITNEVQMLINQARELAASPYSHLVQASQTLKDIADLASSVKGVAASVADLENQFEDLYPTAVAGLDPRTALQQALGRTDTARETAQDLARTAAQLERLSQGRDRRMAGALAASQSASGQTAALQSSTQMLAVLAEDLGSMRTILLAQSRLMAQDSARQAAERAAAAETRRQYWGHAASPPPAPSFNPFPDAR
ncbi:P-type conjugative transfer protein TrbJ [Phenylobacterium sp.]|uniref:P-type conjugative transfer protein TrbJ n=1 Tax=Phenylobacterium sp. TaxID=1871053 RepID=UPI002FC59DC3